MSTGIDNKTLVIDNYLRKISIPSGITCLGVEYDDDVMHLDFKMPRYLGDTDLSKFSIRVNYLNAQGEPDVYSVKNPTITSDHIAFTWLVGPTAVAYKGDTKFNVCLKLLDSDGYIDKEYNTTIASLPVLEGLETEESVVSRYTDILEQWKTELFGIGDTEEANMRAVSQEEQEKLVQKGAEVLATIPEEYQTTVKMAEEGVRTKADAIVCSAQGELITVSDSSDDHIRNLRVFGKTGQSKTTGAQLFNPFAQQNNSFGNATVHGDGSEITVVGAYYVSWPIALKAGVTYYINFETAGAGAQRAVRFEYGDKEITNTITNPAAFTPTRDTVSVYLYSGLGTENCVVYKNFMISEGDTPVPWEPYSAGHASPSPDWPQPLRSVESSEITITGKNLLDMSANGYYVDGMLKIPYTSYNSYTGGFNLIRVYPGRTYTFSYKFTTGDRLILTFLDKDKKLIGDVKIGWGQYLYAYSGRYGAVGDGATFTIPEDSNAAYLDVHLCQMNECGEGNFNYYYDLQLEEGPAVTEYEPYKETKISTSHIINGIPVTSGGNYTDTNGQQWICDEIDFERGVYIQRVGQMTLSNDSNWYYNTDTVGKEFFYTSENNNAKAWETRLYSSHFPAIGGKVGMESDYWMQFSGSGGIRFRHKDLTSLDKLAAWLPENPVSICYVLATPIEIPLTAEELETFKALKTNYPNTTVLNDVGAYMELSYNADTKTYVDNGIKQTVTDVLEAIANGSY
jgi:hypothetical protein